MSKVKKRKPSSALMKEFKPSAELAAVIGEQPISRSQAVSKLWKYFKANDRQNPENKRNLLADEKLRPLFGKDEITMFEIGRIVNENLET